MVSSDKGPPLTEGLVVSSVSKPQVVERGLELRVDRWLLRYSVNPYLIRFLRTLDRQTRGVLQQRRQPLAPRRTGVEHPHRVLAGPLQYRHAPGADTAGGRVGHTEEESLVVRADFRKRAKSLRLHFKNGEFVTPNAVSLEPLRVD